MPEVLQKNLPEPESAALTAVEAVEKQAAASGTFSALRHRDYQLYFGGQLVSVVGTWMQIIAQSWMVYQLSKSELMLGIVGFASAIPALFISPFGGVVVDSVPKRRLLVFTQAGAMLLAFILAALTLAGLLQVWHIIALAVVLGVVNSFDAPARQAFVVEMVGREDLTNAIALNSMMFNGARVIGPAMGGLLLGAVGPAWCFFLNGLSFLAVIGGLLLMRVKDVVHAGGMVNPLSKFREGIRYAYSHHAVLGVLVLAAVFAVFGGAYSTLLPAFVDQRLHTGASGYGVINAAIGAGAVIGALLVARYGSRPGRRVSWMLRASLAFPVLLVLFAYNSLLWLALVLGAGLGFSFMLQFANFNSLIQLNVSDEMRGRVLALYSLIFFGLAPLGNLLAGWSGELLGLSLTIALSAAVSLALGAAIVIAVPGIRKLE